MLGRDSPVQLHWGKSKMVIKFSCALQHQLFRLTAKEEKALFLKLVIAAFTVSPGLSPGELWFQTAFHYHPLKPPYD